jgi:aspartyl-tRNA(Asn)/glutamyl-tRNA(Gln) amidotransferase subunit C
MAELARLELEPGEAERLGADFARVLEHFQELAALELDPEEGSAGSPADVRLRDDEPRAGLTPDEALANAPARVDDFYRVPRVVGGAP